MNILIIGGGGREHTIAWKLAQSPNCGKLFVAPGNAGTHKIATNLALGVTDFEGIKQAVLDNSVQMVIVGPEDPLVNGIHDFFLADAQLQEIIVIGPQQAAATLEGSKEFAKEFMKANNIPTAQYASFTAETVEDGCRFLETMKPPFVLKADGLAAGKGVLIIEDLAEAQDELRQMLVGKKFGAASQKVVIEEFLDGIELSCFVLTDGKNYHTLPMAKDYKRIGEGDTGLNTGGMGAISPVPFASAEFIKKIEDRVIKPTMDGFQKSNLPFQGFVFIGLIKVGEEPFVIEYNVRMGDPETEVVFPRIQNDWVVLFQAVGTQTLDQHQLQIDPRTATTIMAVSGGYPEAYEKGKTITGIEGVEDSIVFHAGTQMESGVVKTSGGRVLAVTSFGADHKEALSKSYETLEKVDFDGIYYRKDLGFDL
ncbi:phosphoribosylamine--glycine ligase [Flavobacteriaceae bacterium]|jgi:phosphoribosylamine--glycine ligase|nr:phosphoribosylamine--glycine ligase [Flavobacteriaceae bacterium]MDC1279332.1 phosphoribosylamine--glycine ligase [bacterium]